ncbi:outer membrane protein N [Salmonella enterica subsp. enterica]|nr:outer membrane protein N [Salmonella enterica subsp. enterica]
MELTAVQMKENGDGFGLSTSYDFDFGLKPGSCLFKF